MKPLVRVLVVDDSAFARKVVREVLSRDEQIEVVGIARDGIDALEKITELHPDVITLDLVMPSLDGVGVLRALSELPEAPAVVIVSMADEESELGITALQLGAFDVVRKPTALANDHLYELGDELRAKVRAAGNRAQSIRPRRAGDVPVSTFDAPKNLEAEKTKLLLIGASTGGPQALTMLIRALPADFPVPVAIVLHMPEGYTDAFARRVDEGSRVEVMEARDGLELERGRVIIARAGMHLSFRAQRDKWVCSLDLTPRGTPHRPAVDVMFQSGAALTGAATLGVVLTGMGEDGLVGSQAIHAAGGRLLTEAESSCVVYGMPRVVAEAGISTASSPIDSMVALITAHL